MRCINVFTHLRKQPLGYKHLGCSYCYPPCAGMLLDLPQADMLTPSSFHCVWVRAGVCVCVCVCAHMHACMLVRACGWRAGEQFHPYLQAFRQGRSTLVSFTPLPLFSPCPPLQVWPTSDSDFWNFPRTTIADGVLMNELKLRWIGQKQMQEHKAWAKVILQGATLETPLAQRCKLLSPPKWHYCNWLGMVWCCGWLTERT